MEMGMVGLGRMGGNMVLRLMKRGHRMIAFDRSADAVKEKASQGAVPALSVQEFVKAFQSKPRVMWVMVPAGDPTTKAIDQLVDGLSGGVPRRDHDPHHARFGRELLDELLPGVGTDGARVLVTLDRFR